MGKWGYNTYRGFPVLSMYKTGCWSLKYEKCIRYVSCSSLSSCRDKSLNRMVVSNMFYFHPYLVKIPILTNIFQMG